VTNKVVLHNLEWIETPNGIEYTMRLTDPEVDIIARALWYYQTQFHSTTNRHWQLADALRKIILRAGVEVIWNRNRAKAVLGQAPESP
jgi:hypothetical protein